MPLTKTQLSNLIKEKDDLLKWYKREEQEIRDGKKYGGDVDPEMRKIHSCSNSIAQIRLEGSLEVLQEILKSYYKPRKPSKKERARKRIKRLRKTEEIWNKKIKENGLEAKEWRKYMLEKDKRYYNNWKLFQAYRFFSEKIELIEERIS